MPDDLANSASPPAPGMPPGGPGASNPGQPPFGSSPVSQPTPNRGQEAAGLSRLALIVRLLQETVSLLPASSKPGQDVVKALGILAKHVPEGSVPPGVQQATMQSLMQKQQQMTPQIAAMRAMSAGQPPGGAPPAPPQGQ